MITALLLFCSIAVDLGRVQLAKTQLQTAADAAARAAAADIDQGTSTIQSDAIYWAGVNSADGHPVVLQSSDIEIGYWAGSTFSNSSAQPSNAVRVTARLSAARGTAVPLFFAQAGGVSSCDVAASSVVSMTPVGYGVIGLNSITMSGNTTTSYWSTSGSTSNTYGNIASNGNITLSGSSYINGNARPGVSGIVIGGAGRVSGSTTPLAAALSYPDAVWPSTNDNGTIPSGVMSANSMTIGKNKTVTLNAGTYVVQDFSMGANSTLNLTGPVTIYVYGDVSLSGSVNTNSNLPQNFTVQMGPRNTTGAPPGTMTIGGSSALYATVYAPQSAITLSGSGDIYGSVLGQSISMTGTSAIHYDLALQGGGVLSLVK